MRRVSTIVEKFMLCSFAHHACSALLQGFSHEEELCKVTETWHIPWM